MALLSNTDLGAKFNWLIGGALVPMRVISRPQFTIINGRNTQMVEAITYQTPRDGGEPYLRKRVLNTYFIEPRTDVVPALDGDPGHPKPIAALLDELREARMAFDAARAAALTLTTEEPPFVEDMLATD